MSDGVLLATDLLVWVQRGSEAAARVVNDEPRRKISIITYMELLQSVTTRLERCYISGFLELYGLVVLPLTDNIGHRTAVYVEEYRISIADGLLAATAVENGLPIISCCAEGFASIAGLELRLVSP